MLSKDLELTLSHAFKFAKEKRHEFMTVEAAPDRGKVVQLELPRFARPDEHFETRRGPKDSTKKGGM